MTPNTLWCVVRGCRAEDTDIVLGHAFRNKVMRCLASDRPDLVSGIVLLAAGGAHPPKPPENLEDLAAVADTSATPQQRSDALGRAFFEPSSDPSLWLQPSGPGSADLYSTCVQPPLEGWWHGGDAPILVIQAGKDRSAIPANGEDLAEAFPHA